MAGIGNPAPGGKQMAKPDEIRRIGRIAWDLRADVVKMIGVGKAGHLGGSCSLAEIVAALYFAKMRFDPKAFADPWGRAENGVKRLTHHAARVPHPG